MLKIKSILLSLSYVFVFAIGIASAQVSVCSNNDYACLNGGVNNYYTNQVYTPTYGSNINTSQKYPELCPHLVRTLSLGDTGNDVKRLQVVLGQEGIAYLGATGYFGPVTKGAVKIFQLRNGILQTGNVGPQTLARMRLLWCSGSSGVPTGTINPGINQNYYNSSSNGPLEVSIAPISSSDYSVTIGWNAKYASSCSINNEAVQPNGQKVYNISYETNFTISCVGFNNARTSKTITLRPNQSVTNLPIVNLSINPSTALVNTYATLYWTSTNTYSCTLNSQNVQTSGSQQILVPSTQTAYQLSCVGQNGQTFSSTVYANPGSTVNTGISSASISASVNNINSGSPVTLNWSSINTSSCTVGGNGATFFSGINGTQIVYPTQTTTYTINCTPSTSGPSVTNQVVVYVNGSTNIIPTVAVTANPTNITYAGQAVTLNLTTANVGTLSSCSLTGGNLNSVTIPVNSTGTSGSYTGTYTFYPTISATYTVNCMTIGNGQNTAANFYVSLNGSNTGNITATISANPTNTTYSGQPVTLTWSSTNANYCNITANNSTLLSNQSSSGSTTVYPSIGTNYQITCHNYNGQNGANYVYVTVNGSSNNVTANLYANTQNINSGSSVTLTWSSTNASYCNIIGGTTNLYNQTVVGSYLVYPTTGTTYQLTCYNSSGQNATSNIVITVNGTNTGNVVSTLSANPTSISYAGQPVTLTWSATNASYCNMLNSSNATIASNLPTSGTMVVYPTVSGNYRVNCYATNSSNNDGGYAYVTVLGSVGASSVTVSPTAVTVASGASTILTLTKTNINSCTVTGGTYSNSTVTGNTLTVSPTQTTTYNFSCVGTDSVTRTASATVSVTTTSPQLTLNPENKTILHGEYVTIVITKQNISSCTIRGGVYTTATNIGSTGSIIVTPNITTTYTFTCTGTNGGAITKSSIITVNSTPTIDVVANPTTIVSGNSSTITLTRQNTNTCTVSGGGYLNTPLSNSTSTLVVKPTTTTTYTFNCTGIVSGTTSDNVVVTVTTAPSLTVTPQSATIKKGEIVTFVFTKNNITTCSVNGFDIGGISYWPVAPQTTTTYNFTCNTTTGGTVSTSTLVTVSN